MNAKELVLLAEQLRKEGIRGTVDVVDNTLTLETFFNIRDAITYMAHRGDRSLVKLREELPEYILEDSEGGRGRARFDPDGVLHLQAADIIHTPKQ